MQEIGVTENVLVNFDELSRRTCNVYERLNRNTDLVFFRQMLVSDL
jgi:hypothetical protein